MAYHNPDDRGMRYNHLPANRTQEIMIDVLYQDFMVQVIALMLVAIQIMMMNGVMAAQHPYLIIPVTLIHHIILLQLL